MTKASAINSKRGNLLSFYAIHDRCPNRIQAQDSISSRRRTAATLHDRLHRDRFVRVFHWSLALGVVLNYWVLEAGDDAHEWLGYALAALVGARIVWGFRGPANARFADFVVGPRRVLHSLGNFAEDYREHRGHSPLAGWMILFMLASVIGLAVSGWMQGLDAFWGDERLELIHEFLGNGLIGAAGVHVAAVLWIQRRFRLPLLRSMLGGPRRAAGTPE